MERERGREREREPLDHRDSSNHTSSLTPFQPFVPGPEVDHESQSAWPSKNWLPSPLSGGK